MWPESSSVSTVNLEKKFTTIPEISNFPRGSFFGALCTLCSKKRDYIFYNNFNNKCPITIIFGIVSGKSMRHRNMVSFPISPI